MQRVLSTETGFHYVRVVTAHRGGSFTHGEDLRFSARASAVEECDRLQAEFDADCEPRRVYVLDCEKDPTQAGGRGVGRRSIEREA
jgi:hypothetical protein